MQPPQDTAETIPHRGLLLVVDDDATFRTGFTRLLVRQNYACLGASDCEAALEVLQTHPIDALISDLHLPGPSGIELIRRAAAHRPGLPAFLLTGRPTWETAAQSIDLRVAGYIQKPPVLADLTPQLDTHIAAYRRLQTIQHSRQRLADWEKQLAALEESLNHRSTSDYLPLTLHHIAVQLAEFATAASFPSHLRPTAHEHQNAHLIAALRQTIDILEHTRKNFKSQELGELRKQLTRLLHSTEHGEPASPPAP